MPLYIVQSLVYRCDATKIQCQELRCDRQWRSVCTFGYYGYEQTLPSTLAILGNRVNGDETWRKDNVVYIAIGEDEIEEKAGPLFALPFESRPFLLGMVSPLLDTFHRKYGND